MSRIAARTLGVTVGVGSREVMARPYAFLLPDPKGATAHRTPYLHPGLTRTDAHNRPNGRRPTGRRRETMTGPAEPPGGCTGRHWRHGPSGSHDTGIRGGQVGDSPWAGPVHRQVHGPASGRPSVRPPAGPI